MGNMLIDAALKQVERDIQRVQESTGSPTNFRMTLVKRAIASVDALRAALKAL